MLSSLAEHWPIRTKLFVLAGSSCAVAVCLCTAAYLTANISRMKAEKLRQLQTQADVLAFNASAVVSFADEAAGNALLKSFQLEPSVDVAALYDGQGQLLSTFCRQSQFAAPHCTAVTGTAAYTSDGQIELWADVTDGAAKLGTLYIRANTQELQSDVAQQLWLGLIVAGASLGVAAMLSLTMQRKISGPLASLSDAAERITHDEDYSIRVEHQARDELGSLCRAFNTMLDRMQTTESALRDANDFLEERVETRTAELETRTAELQQRTCELQDEIQQRERTAAELVRARDSAECANVAKSQFLANMSHEIRTPMNAIIGFTDLLLRGAVDNETEQRDYLHTIQHSGKHLLHLINDILDISKIESGKLELERMPTAPHRLLAEVISVMRVRAREKGLNLEYQCVGGVPAYIETDPGRLQQALINLVGNAIKFTTDGEVRVTVSMADVNGLRLLKIDVQDTGIGIPPAQLERIFDPFVQADSSVTRRFGGTGLGLAITRRIAQALGGDVTATSFPGTGSVFTLTLDPGETFELQHFSAPTSDVIGAEVITPSVAAPRPATAPASILVVEDGDTNRKLIRLLLSREGHSVVTAENGSEGVREALAATFDLILMDMQMPVMDGYTATARIREHGIATPILALTAHAMVGDEQKCLAAGCDGYLTKPIERTTLLDSLAKHLPACDTTV